jgi:hypothetical protein
MPLDLLCGQTFHVATDDVCVGRGEQVFVVFADAVDTVTPLPKRPRIASLDETLTDEEVTHGAVEKINE